MSLKSRIGQLWLFQEFVAYRPPQVYENLAYDLFNITGPVIITLLGGRATAPLANAPEVLLTINGVDADGAGASVPVVLAGAVGTVVVSTLNAAGTLVNAAGVPRTIALLHSKGFVSGIQPAAIGVIIADFSTGAAIDVWTGDWFCVYRKLSPESEIAIA